MATIIEYPGETGDTTDFSIPFTYIAEAYVLATVDDVAVSFTFLSQSIIRLDVAADGDLRIYRATPSSPLVDFSDGTVLTDDDLNLGILQALHVAEEALDGISSAAGDMLRSTYDSNADGKVAAADEADVAPWAGITGKPTTFTPASHTHTGSEVTDLHAVATSGDYSDLTGTPTIPVVSDVAYGSGWNGVLDAPSKNAVYDKIEALVLGGGAGDMAKATYDTDNDGTVDAADVAAAAPWSGITGKPSVFTPDTHTHTASGVTDFSTAADARITAALGSAVQAYDVDTAKLDVAQTFTALQVASVEAMTDGATITPTGAKHLHTVTLAGNRTLANPTAITVGATYVFKLTQDAIGSRTASWGAAFDWAGGTAPTLTTAANGIDVFSGVSFDGTSIQMTTVGQAFS